MIGYSLDSPYIRGRFITDAIVRRLSSEKIYPGLKIYTEKVNSLKPPYLFVSTENIISVKETKWLQYKDYLMLVYGRFAESNTSYADLDELGCLLTDLLEYIELPMGYSRKQGEQKNCIIKPVKGTSMSNQIVREKDYSEMYFYVRYRIQVFRENPIEPLMREEKVKIKKKEGEK